MGSDDLTVRILIEIRDEIRATNARVDALGTSLGTRIDTTNERIDRLGERISGVETSLGARIDQLGDRITGVELRFSSQMTALIGSTRDLYEMLQDRLELRDRVERCERAIDDLNRRVDS